MTASSSRVSRPPLPLAGALLVLAAGACGGPGADERLPTLFEAPDFTLVDQTGDTLRSAELAGQAWVAHFFFTNCQGVCPVTTARVAELRDSLAADGVLGDGVRLVSISVDPARDSVAALHDYAARFGGSPPSEWAFLTGASSASIRRLLQDGFKVMAHASPPAADTSGDYQVNHSPRLEMVDREGRVRGVYDATDADAISRVLSDLEALLR